MIRHAPSSFFPGKGNPTPDPRRRGTTGATAMRFQLPNKRSS
ncbi:MAG TPA: hypothetical protein VFU49_02070 [Ktedonobacteraceae bacterium]|nr:hypothetical protein [Ktedonobacteraceae bacterium]